MCAGGDASLRLRLVILMTDTWRVKRCMIIIIIIIIIITFVSPPSPALGHPVGRAIAL